MAGIITKETANLEVKIVNTNMMERNVYICNQAPPEVAISALIPYHPDKKVMNAKREIALKDVTAQFAEFIKANGPFIQKPSTEDVVVVDKTKLNGS